MSLTKQEAESKMYALISDAEEAIAKAEAIAVEHGLSFDFSVAYGMGGSFYSPEYLKDHEYLVSNYYLDADEGGWVASSQTC